MAPKLRPGVRIDEFLTIDDPDDEGTYDARWGHAWMHVKLHDHAKPYMLANELVAARLAASLGLPTLPGETARDYEGRDCWVTPRISEDGGTTPPPATEAQIAAEHPTVVAGMLAFDAWIHNLDRTTDNVLFDPRLGVWLIDHENSLAEPDGRAFAMKADDAARTPLSWHGFAGQAIDQAAVDFWAARIEILSQHVIERPLEEAFRRGLLKRTETDWLLRYLLARRQRIRSLIPTTPKPGKSHAVVIPVDQYGQYDLFSTSEE